MKQKLKYVNSLDGVRAIAALLILWLHFWSVADAGGSVVSFLRKTSVIGQIGVPLFFVLSGFLITRILISQKDDNNYFSNFYIKRALRIFPLYYLFLIIVFYLYPLIIRQPVVPFSLSWPNWIYLQNFAITFNWPYQGPNHLWSLAVEEHFYLLWPLIVYFLNTRQLKNICIAICIIEPVVRFLLFSNHIEIFYFSFTRFDELSFGALLAVSEVQKRNPKNSFIYTTGGISLAILIVFFTQTGEANIWVQVFKYTLLGIFFYSLLFALIFGKAKLLHNFFSNSILRFIGKISYGLYIYHPFAYLIIEHHFKMTNVWFNFFTAVGLSFGLSIASFYLFERQFLKYKERFEKKRYKAGQNSAPQLLVVTDTHPSSSTKNN